MSRDQQELELVIQIEVRQPQSGYAGLRVNDSFKIKPKNFLEMCEILGRFNKLAEEIKRGGL